ncbi:MAG: S9 family peptidase [Proteobacteria bacterium]|nr:S9 family peptidase [Pseudomonadota bacterium]
MPLAARPVLPRSTPMPATTPLPPYPPSVQAPVVETHFGEQVVDPWRWLEADVRTDPKVEEWVVAQSAFTDAYLKALPERAVFERRLKGLFNYARFGVPREEGGRLFYAYNSGMLNQAQLLVRDAASPKGRVLLDPNAWASDGATALDAWEPSPDGNLLAYTVQDGGSDWRTMKFVAAADGQALADELKWVKFSAIAWVGSEGVLYSRFAEPQPGEAFQARNYDQQVFYHRLGTPQAEDRLVHATPDKPSWGHAASVTGDGRWLVVTSHEGTDPLTAIGLAPIGRGGMDRGDWQVRPLIPGMTAQWDLIDGIGDTLWFVTSKEAPLKKVVRVDLSGAVPVFTTVVPETDANLEGAAIVGDRLVLAYLRDVKSDVRLFTLDGTPAGTLALPGVGSLAGLSGKPGKAGGHFGFTSFTMPSTVFAFDEDSGKAKVWEKVALRFAPHDFKVEQVFYPSKDGTKIPMFVVRRKDATGPVPTILYGYGGFNVSLPPAFSSARMAWLESGGAYAIANLRGGGEYGDAWHDAGRRAAKQNVFDDCIAAAEWLIANGIAPKGGLAVEGGSNGGLLVGAVVNQRPDLFAAAHPAVGVMDMLRFDRFTAGRYWVDDYGHPDREADWKVLRAYSPYHNIRGGVDYPAILVTTADTDDRVVPGHSFKYAAALQAARIGDKPHLIRIETRAGHGSGKPVDKIIAEAADVYAFLAHWTGLSPRP